MDMDTKMEGLMGGGGMTACAKVTATLSNRNQRRISFRLSKELRALLLYSFIVVHFF